MLKKTSLVLLVVVLSLIVAVPVVFAARGGEGGRGDGPIIYVRSRGLYYDSIVTADPLPWNGPFQQLFPITDDEGNVIGLETELGPGDVGYVGGRWWVDVNSNGYQDEDDHFFLCPLLGPGRAEP